jgi:hypothetical protein
VEEEGGGRREVGGRMTLASQAMRLLSSVRVSPGWTFVPGSATWREGGREGGMSGTKER